MRVSITLSSYIAREFLIAIATVAFALVSLVLVIDFLELSRRTAGNEAVTLVTAVKMVFLHAPYLSQRVLPFAVLVGVMLALSRLTRTSELAVVRAAGVSAAQFLLPGLAIALAIGIFAVTVFNPLAAALLARYEQMEAKYVQGASGELAVLTSGLWLRQLDGANESVVHATGVSQPDMRLHDVIVFVFDESGSFQRRIDARSAQLADGYWLLHDALLAEPDAPVERHERYRFTTDLTVSRIQESFAPPSTLSFWELPGFIATLEMVGFSAVKHQVHFHNLLSSPLLLCGMVLIAAAFSLRRAQRPGVGLVFAAGLIAGFVFYFFSDVVIALGLAGRIPPALAGWSPSAVVCLLGLGTLLHIEEG